MSCSSSALRIPGSGHLMPGRGSQAPANRRGTRLGRWMRSQFIWFSLPQTSTQSASAQGTSCILSQTEATIGGIPNKYAYTYIYMYICVCVVHINIFSFFNYKSESSSSPMHPFTQRTTSKTLYCDLLDLILCNRIRVCMHVCKHVPMWAHTQMV